MSNYTNEFTIKTFPQQLYNAITTQKGLANWWTNHIKMYPQIGGIVTFHFGKKTYIVMKITKLDPLKEVTWKCVEQYFKISGSDKTDEWIGTTVKFKLNENKDKTTTLEFLHSGFTLKLSSFKECKKEWDYYLNSLKKYLETGKGTPFNN